MLTWGELKLAPYYLATQDSCQQIKDALTNAEEKKLISLHENHQQLRYSKLLWNIPFCSLSILCQKPPRDLASQEPFRTFVQALMKEIQTIVQASGATIEDNELALKLNNTANLPETYYPSMYHDWRGKKPLEVEYIITHPLQYAKKYNVATPLLEFIEKAMTQSPIETLTGTDLQTMLDSNSISMPTCITDNTLSLGLG